MEESYVCRECGRSRPRSLISLKPRDGGLPRCHPCGNRKHVAKRDVSRRVRVREFIQAFKLAQGCVWCGYRKCAEALQFDHLDPSEKDGTTWRGQAIEKNWSMDRILAEIGKCQVLCANCHAERTKAQREAGEFR